MSEKLKSEIIEVISNLTKISKEEIDKGIKSEKSFTDYGIDSFSIVEIVYAIENKYDIDIPQQELLAVTNIEQLTELINKLINSRG